MWTFIVLGLIPSTNFQISFQLWLLVTAYILGLLVAHQLIRRLIHGHRARLQPASPVAISVYRIQP